MTSILTNSGALVALQTLKATNRAIETAQNRISTGRHINSAADGSAVWAVAKIMETDSDNSKTIQAGLTVAKEVVSIAVDSAGIVTDQLTRIHDLLLAAANRQGAPDHYLDEIKGVIGNIANAISTTQFNGVNLLSARGTGGTDPETYTVLSGLDRIYGEAITKVSVIEVPSVNLEERVLAELENLFAGEIDISAIGTGATGSAGRDGTLNSEEVFRYFANQAGGIGGWHDTLNSLLDAPPSERDGETNRHHTNLGIFHQILQGGGTFVGTTNTWNGLPENRDVNTEEQMALATAYQALDVAAADFGTNGEPARADLVKAASEYEAEVERATGWSVDDLDEYIRTYHQLPTAEEKTEYFIERTGGTKTPEELAGVQPSIVTQVDPLAKVQELLDISIKATAMLGAIQNRIESQADDIDKRSDALDISISALIDTNLEEESARLKALQTQQQLGLQALSIANQAPQAVLSLFR